MPFIAMFVPTSFSTSRHALEGLGRISAIQENTITTIWRWAFMLSSRDEFTESKKIVLTGTICARPKFTPVPFREENLWDGYPKETNAPYGVAKKALIVMAQVYREQYGRSIVVALPVNLYGPRDNFDLETSHVIPAIIRKCVTAVETGEREVPLWGDGTPTREFLYVENCAQGLVRMAERCETSEPIYLGSEEEISIRDLATMIGAACRFEGQFVWGRNRPNGQPRRALDVTRARDRLGFVASVRLAAGIAKTIEWYEQNREALA